MNSSALLTRTNGIDEVNALFQRLAHRDTLLDFLHELHDLATDVLSLGKSQPPFCDVTFRDVAEGRRHIDCLAKRTTALSPCSELLSSVLSALEVFEKLEWRVKAIYLHGLPLYRRLHLKFLGIELHLQPLREVVPHLYDLADDLKLATTFFGEHR